MNNLVANPEPIGPWAYTGSETLTWPNTPGFEVRVSGTAGVTLWYPFDLANLKVIGFSDNTWISPSPSPPIDLLSKLYDFRTNATVARYLEANPRLVAVLFAAHSQISRIFGGFTPIAIEVFQDPDEGASEELFVLIATSLTPEAANLCLRQLDREWWLAASAEAASLSIDVEYGL